MEQVKGKFSVILPYYNGSKYIQETLVSILAQTYNNFELLLIDDGSPSKIDSDFLVSLVKSINDDRIKYNRKNNGGLSDTRNYGIEKSEGEYIAFIDQDDLWGKDKLLLQAAVFNANKNVNFICTDANIIGEKSEEMRIGEKWGFKDGVILNPLNKLFKGNFVACSSVAFRKSIIADVGYSNRAFVVIPDYEYFFRFAEKMDFYFIAKSLLSYRLHEGNTTKQLFRGACEEISVLFDRRPRKIINSINLSVHFLRCYSLIFRLWLNKIII